MSYTQTVYSFYKFHTFVCNNNIFEVNKNCLIVPGKWQFYLQTYISMSLIFKMWRRTKVQKSLCCVCLLTSIYLIIYLNYEYTSNSNPRNGQFSTQDENEIRTILRETPYLWRKFEFKENETVRSRINDQINWIKKISSTKYIQSAEVKQILVQDDITLYYGTKGKMHCPYAPEFEEKCNIIRPWWIERFLGKLQYANMDAVVTMRNWESRGTSKIPSNVQQIMYILEPPSIAKGTHLGINNALLASYWRGSDIPIPYRQWITVSNSSYANPNGFEEIYIKPQKTKMVAAIVSNCNTINDRMGYIKQLQKYIEVDVYGECGNFSCAKSKNQDCLSMIGHSYKFFLAIENSNCYDYISEKFFENALKYNILPIVLGAHPENYRTAAPANSYIHVEDFSSPKELASYLNTLNDNDNLYKEYFKWIGTGFITDTQLADFFCRVCGMLFYGDFVKAPNWNYNLVTFKDVNVCLPYGKWYWK